MYLYEHARTTMQKQHNQTTLVQAEAIRCVRVQSLINEELVF